MKLTHASVFSGIGGPEIAAAMLGWDNVFHCEINPFGRAVLDYWYPKAKSYEDITKTDFSEWRGRVTVLTGGFPCQPFSYAGQRRGAEDDRYLWPHMFRCIDQVQPDWVVAENVAGILTMVEQGEVSAMESQGTLFDEGDAVRRYRLRETFTLQRICDDLEGHGYEVQPVLVPACAVGAPHRRDRVFIVARRVTADTCSGGQSAPEQQGERERTQVQQQSREQSQHGIGRPSASRHATDTERESIGAKANDVRQGLATISESEGLQGSDASGFSEPKRGSIRRHSARHNRANGQGESSIPEDSMHGRQLHGQHEVEGHQRNEWDISAGGSERLRGIASRFETAEAIAGCGRWAQFPSVSPVHRGNDGLPFPLDDLAIPAGKWRTESLKAYGNAIVPQVMYEIFRAIEIVERENL